MTTTILKASRNAILVSSILFGCAFGDPKFKKTYIACNGSKNCNVCTNCSRCKHCKAGKVCGVCSPESFEEKVKPVVEENPQPEKKKPVTKSKPAHKQIKKN